MKYIAQIEATGFKARDFCFPLHPLTYLVGPNGAGKSSVLEAIQILQLGYLPRLGAKTPASVMTLAREQDGDRRISLSALVRHPTPMRFIRTYRAKGETIQAGGSVDPPRGESGIRQIHERIRAELGHDPLLIDLGLFLGMSQPDRRRALYALCSVHPLGPEWAEDRIRETIQIEIAAAPAALTTEILGHEPVEPAELQIWLGQSLARAQERESFAREQARIAEAGILTLGDSVTGTNGSNTQVSGWRLELQQRGERLAAARQGLAAAEQRQISQRHRQERLAEIEDRIRRIEPRPHSRAKPPVESPSHARAEAAHATLAALNEQALELEQRLARRARLEAERGRVQLQLATQRLQLGSLQSAEVAADQGCCVVLQSVRCPLAATVAAAVQEEMAEQSNQLGIPEAEQRIRGLDAELAESDEATMAEERQKLYIRRRETQRELDANEATAKKEAEELIQAAREEERQKQEAATIQTLRQEHERLQKELAEGGSTGQRQDLLAAEIAGLEAAATELRQRIATAEASYSTERERTRLESVRVEQTTRAQLCHQFRAVLGPAGIQGELIASLVEPLTAVVSPIIEQIWVARDSIDATHIASCSIGSRIAAPCERGRLPVTSRLTSAPRAFTCRPTGGHVRRDQSPRQDESVRYVTTPLSSRPDAEFELQMLTPEGREVCDFGLRRDGLFVSIDALSAGETAVLAAAIGAGLMAISDAPCKYLLLDNLDVIDDLDGSERRSRLLLALARLVEAKKLGQVIAAGLQPPRTLPEGFHLLNMENHHAEG